MGIRGLQKYLVTKLDGVVLPTTLPANATLVIDGNGWVFQLIETSQDFRPELGGCYSSLEESVAAEINRLRSCGLNLLVLFDGPEQRLKSHTRKARATGCEEKWAKFYDFCEENVKHSDGESFPLPPLTEEQLFITLKNLGVPIKQCAGEADQEIAKIVQLANQGLAVGEETHFAYGRDSDYFAMKDCPYIMFGSIVLVENESLFTSPQRMRATPTKASLLRQKPTHQAVARVWRRIDICEALGVSEATFLNWVLLLGNDYTGHFDRHTDFNIAVPCELRGYRTEVLEELLAVAAVAAKDGVVIGAAKSDPSEYGEHGENNDSVLVDSADSPEVALSPLQRELATQYRANQSVKVQLAVDYSLAVYELQILDHFPLDAPDDSSDSDEENEVTQVSNRFFDFSIYGTPQVGKEGNIEGEGYFATLPSYARAQAGSSGKVKLSGPAEHALLYLKQRNTINTVTTDGTEEEKVVTAEHLAALTVMLRQIYLHTEAAKDNTISASNTPMSAKKTPFAHSAELITPEFPYRPHWADAVAAYVFQRTCEVMLMFLSHDAYRTKNNTPRQMFNGALFHRILMLQRAQALEPTTTVVGNGSGATTAASGTGMVNNVAVAAAATTTTTVGNDTSVVSLADAMRMLTMNNTTTTTTTTNTTSNTANPSPSLPDVTTSTASSTTTIASPITSPTPDHDILPIDAFREEILSRIHRDRVTIIHGETGCGKSSCLPRFLLEEAEKNRVPVQIMVSQPRRIAVTSLLKRLRTTLGDKVGMRMGHGIKDETKNTKIHYVTTGYLVRALAHQPDRFNSCTHLIIDEVHERSVDGDLVCLLARDLLRSHPTIRVILMSATIHTSLYRDYFASRNDGTYGDMECLSVGVRRFPVTIQYAEDLVKFGEKGNKKNKSGGTTREKAFGSQVQSAAQDLVKLTYSPTPEVPAKLGLTQYKAAVSLVRAIGVEGTGVLIFVSGINDITEIVTMLEPYPNFLVFPIHSDIPADEQELAFGVTPGDKVKVVVATNAAESSVTIPDCDVVICLGTHKSLQYSALNHRTQLVNTWISKASGTQRAGRTGRVRPGKVYRLYSKNLFEKQFGDHEQAEVHRRPLQDVVLSMWVMLENSNNFTGVTPFLQGLIEAPDMRNITQSYQYLYESDLITDPNDSGYLTAMGRLTGELPVDIALGRMIAYGVMLGVAAEAVVLAAALSLPKAPFRYANSIYSTPEEYNQIVKNKFLTATEFDQGSYSEPIMLLRLLLKWRTLQLNPHKLGEYCAKRGLLQAVMRQFKSMAEHLCHTVDTRLAKFRPNNHTHTTTSHKNDYSTHSHTKKHSTTDLNSALSKSVDLDSIGELTDTKLNLLRMILLWSSSGNVLKMNNKSRKRFTDTSVLVHSNEVSQAHMRDIFGYTVPYTYSSKGKRVYDAKVLYWESGNYFSCLVRLMDNLCAVSEMLALQCSWVVVKSSSDHSTLVSFAYLNTYKDSTEALLIEHVFGQASRLHSGATIATAITQAGHFMQNVTVTVIPDASKSELKRLNDFRDLIDVSLSVLIPVIGNAKVTAVNCVPSEPTLQQLFFGDTTTDSSDTSDTTTTNTPNGATHTNPNHSTTTTASTNNNTHSEKERKIAVQITHGRSVLTFPEDHTDSDCEASDFSIPLIEDLPLGHRLISCCQQQVGKSRNKVLMLNVHDSGNSNGYNNNSGHKNVAVPGSIEYAHQQLQRLKQTTTTASNDTTTDTTHDRSHSNTIPSQKIEVKLGIIGATWVNIRALKTTPSANNTEDQHSLKSVNAILPRQSMLSVSYHRGAETLFAVTHSTLVLGVAGDLVACEGVSFLPPGPSWLYLALLCAGADASQVSLFCPEDRLKVSKGQAQRANKVAEMFRTASAIVPRVDIVNMVEEVFYGVMWDVDDDCNDSDSNAAWQKAELRMPLEMQLESDVNVSMNRNVKKGKKGGITQGSGGQEGKKEGKGGKKNKLAVAEGTPIGKRGGRKGNNGSSGYRNGMDMYHPRPEEVPLAVQQAQDLLVKKCKPTNTTAATAGTTIYSSGFTTYPSGTTTSTATAAINATRASQYGRQCYYKEVAPIKETTTTSTATTNEPSSFGCVIF